MTPSLETISAQLKHNIDHLRQLFDQAPDLVIREFQIKQTGELATLVYFCGLVDKNSVNNNVLQPLLFPPGQTQQTGFELDLAIGQIHKSADWETIEDGLYQGKCIMFVDQAAEAILFDAQGWPQRAVEDPQLESSLRGAHQGFLETAPQNVAMLRRYIQNRELKIKELRIGRRGQTQLFILYMGDIAHPDVLCELEDRITQLDIDSVINTGELAERIEDNPYSPFPQFIITERPDATASQLLQGRVAVLVDNSPSALIVPVTFASYFQNIDDYSVRFPVASFLRLIRFFAYMVALFLPSLYISLISFNYEVIPLELILSLGESRERVPFPPLFEALLMEISLEMLREAGVRLPAPIGQTVGVVGAIVIGQAAVQASFVSNVMVIVVALTAIASFIIPNYDMAASIRLLRFPMMLIASLFGLIGLVIGAMTVIGHLIALESLGTPYFNPIAPIRFKDWKDVFVRLPLKFMTNRPESARATQLKRQSRSRSKGGRK